MAALSRQETLEEKQRSSTPGVAGARLNYGLKEEVVKVHVLPEKLEARQAVKVEYDPDVLGLRGPRWDSSVGDGEKPTKWGKEAASTALSNTVSPANINPQDFRTLKGTTHSRADHDAAFHRGVATGWDASTVTNPAEMHKQLERLTSESMASTRKVRDGTLQRYVSPVERSQAVTERVREEKRSQGIDMKELAAKYGEEGAVAMRDILITRRTKGIDNPDGTLARRPQVKGRARPEDIEAVQNLKFGGMLDEDDMHGNHAEGSYVAPEQS